MEKIIIIIFSLLLASCNHMYNYTLKNKQSFCEIDMESQAMHIIHNNKNHSYYLYNGEYVEKGSKRVYLSTKRSIHQEYKITPNITKVITIRLLSDYEKGEEFKDYKKIYCRKETLEYRYSKDAEEPLSEIYFDDNYKILKIYKFENISFEPNY